jgi:16S rRNA (guanine(966)-N(2))-methyltransferase RsmD
MVKEAIFNLIGPGIADAHVLDLFAGSGALGIEALSRGAAGVTFVDREPRGLAILRQNLDALDLKTRARVVRSDVVRWLEASPEEIKRAGVVLLDPPYDDVVLDRALKVIDREVTGATVLAEHSRRQQLPTFERLHVDRQRRYGDTMVTVLRA